MINPIQPFLDQFGVFILDGGFATELEALGADLGDSLWSARLLLDDPALIRRVHAAYLWAGADCIITSTYQATIPGFKKRGLTEKEAGDLIRRSVELAVDERDAFWASQNLEGHTLCLRPLVAASAGPYAAYRADGSEYTGVYDLNEAELTEFHRQRWHILACSEADLLACETIPNFAEARALAGLLAETPDWYAWFSFSCRDGEHISDGTPIADCVSYLDQFERVAAVGVNCTAPRFIPSLISEIREVSDLPVIVYPNSGEVYEVQEHHWIGESEPAEFGTMSREWRKLGAACMAAAAGQHRPIFARFAIVFQGSRAAKLKQRIRRLNKKTYQLSLPKKRISAGILLFDEHGQLLIVEPTYKESWEIPGGVVEANESPRQAVIREAAEELGLYCEPLRLLGVDYSGETDKRTESFHFIFQGEVLPADRVAAIRLKADELKSYRFLPPKEATGLLNKKLRRRVRRCLKVVNKKATLYMEEQRVV